MKSRNRGQGENDDFPLTSDFCFGLFLTEAPFHKVQKLRRKVVHLGAENL